MSAVDEILSQIPMGRLAERLGVDESTAERATRQALPALLGGIQANTDDPGGASSFARAVQQHDGGLVDGGVDVDAVDTTDGAKIVGHVFGANQEKVVGALGGQAGQDLMKQLLPILAPIVMSWLAKKLAGQQGGIGGMLGGILGGVLANQTGGGTQQGGIDLGGLLGGLLGGGRR